jgi:urease accessory protein
MVWHAQLSIDYAREDGKTVARHSHSGPLRVLQSLYPDGPAVCHNVMVHPPGGLVGGDTLDIRVHCAAGSHGLITTPGATRFYRSEGLPARQTTHLQLDTNSRLEWLPLEALCYSGCLAENRLTMELSPGAELLGWDITALGLPHADLPFVQGKFAQHVEMPGVWLERGTLDASDTRLLNSPAGLAGQRCLATLFFVTGSALPKERRQDALDCARDAIQQHALAATAGATSPNARVVVVRAIAPVVEPVMDLLRALRRNLRQQLWGEMASDPRIWSM